VAIAAPEWHNSDVRRAVYIVCGMCAVALAAAGLLLPGLPGTVFLLIASWCFTRSSPRFERWLREHPWLGPALRRHAGAGGMSRSAKRAALTLMWVSVLVSAAILLRVHPAVAIAMVGLGAIGTLSIVFGVRTAPERA
jgi:uncharacterized membrane protein YbaN (DUF454 family)